MNKILITATAASALFAAACGGASNTSGNAANNANSAPTANGSRANVQNVDPKNLPPGLSTSPIPPSSNSTPGIPAPGNANAVPKGTTPTPGIPDPKNINRPVRNSNANGPRASVPDEESIRKMMQGTAKPMNENPVPPPPPEVAESMTKKKLDRRSKRLSN